jgi:hypothetical protein
VQSWFSSRFSFLDFSRCWGRVRGNNHPRFVARASPYNVPRREKRAHPKII